MAPPRPPLIVRALLRAYPASFRARFGEEMAEVVRATLAAESTAAGRTCAWARVLADIARTAPVERVRARRARRQAPPSRTGDPMDALRRDLAYAVRRLARRPGTAAAAIAVLALGIGAATAVFSLVVTVLLRPLPVPEPERLVTVRQADSGRGDAMVPISYPHFRDLRDADAFEAVAALPETNVPFVLAEGEPEQLRGRPVSGTFFDVLRARPLLGRPLAAADDRPGAPRVTVLSHGLWQRRFGGDPAVVGRTVRIDRDPFTIVGVMPRWFQYPEGAELWTALEPSVPQYLERPEVFWLMAVGRLHPGQELGTAHATASARLARFAAARGQAEGVGATVVPVTDEMLGPARPALLALCAAVAVVLLVACANVAALLLAQGAGRTGEMAVRTALGARRGRLVRQLLTESLVVALAGAGAGIAVAAASLRALVALSPEAVPRLDEAALDGRAAAFAVGMSLMAAAACGIVPALRATADGLEERLRAGAARLAPRRRGALAAIVVGEIAVSLALMVGAGLLVRTFLALRALDLGYRAEDVLTVEVALPGEKYARPESQRAFYRALVERLHAVPGVGSAAGVLLRPLAGPVGLDWPFTVEGQDAREAERNPLVNLEAVTPGYFRTMGITLVSGRAFSEADGEAAPGVVVVSRAFAERYWGSEGAVGRRVRLPLPGSPLDGTWLTVVGVAADARYRDLTVSPYDVYLSYLQSPYPLRHVVVRGDGDPAALVSAIRAEVRALDPDQPVADVATMPELVARALGAPRFTLQVFVAFAGGALLLTAIGLYGVLAHTVARGTREFGVRMALGATPADVRRQVFAEGARLAGLGVLLGLAAALAGARLLRALLFQVGPADPVTFATVAALVVAVAVLAAWIPARRATRIDPVAALRAE